MIDLKDGAEVAEKAVDKLDKKPYPTFLVIIIIILGVIIYFQWRNTEKLDERYFTLTQELMKKNNIIGGLKQDSIRKDIYIKKIDTALENALPVAKKIIKDNKK